jgi:hypothetical protein
MEWGRWTGESAIRLRSVLGLRCLRCGFVFGAFDALRLKKALPSCGGGEWPTQVLRYGTASVAMLFVEDNKLEKAKKRGLLTRVEGEMLKTKASPPMILWLWVGALLQVRNSRGDFRDQR